MIEAVLLDWASVRRLAEPRALVDALERALLDGYRPGTDPARSSMRTAHGEVLVMPSAVGPFAGVKVVGLAAANRDRGLPVISGLYLLLDGQTLRPVAILDGAAITEVRTAAVSALAVRHFGVSAARRLVVFGSGPQARAHVATFSELLRVDDVTMVTRTDSRDAVAHADVVLCCTSSQTPLFPASLLREGAVVVAVGTHHPDARELGEDVMAAATVVVEERATAVREAGEVVLAVAAGRFDAARLVELADLVTGRVAVPADRVRVFKSVGMAWEDLVVAAEIYRRAGADA